MFPGLGVDDFLKYFSSRVAIADFLPTEKGVRRVNRGFVLDVRLPLQRLL
jgi:hypothetical protein